MSECTCLYDPETGVAEYTKAGCPMHDNKLVKIAVDFNENNIEGFFYSLVEHAEGEVKTGDRILLYDGENQAEAEIIRIENNLIYSRVDWSTW